MVSCDEGHEARVAVLYPCRRSISHVTCRPSLMERFEAPTLEEFEVSRAWGLLTSVDLHDCNPQTIRSAEAIERFAKELCERLAVKRFGPTQVVEFGDDPKVHGYSMTQLIESSLVSAHFAEQTNSIYLDIFSCKFYDAAEAVRFALAFFEGTAGEALSVLRGCARDLPRGYRSAFAKRNIILQPGPHATGNSPETRIQSA